MSPKHISTIKAHLLINNILNDIQNHTSYRVNASFDPEMDVSAGSTYHFEGNLNVRIGSRDTLKKKITDYDLKELAKRIDILDFVEMLVATYHEREHVLQEEWFITKNDSVTLKMGIENFAHYNNRNYYKDTYHSNICEIDAEKEGIRCAYEKLTKLYNEKEANKLIMAYVSMRQKSPYFIDKDCKNVDEVLEEFDKSFSQQLSCKRIFRYNEFLNSPANDDAFFRCIINNSERQVESSYADISDGWEQRQLMCIANILYRSGYSDLDENHILQKQDWLEDFNKLPTRQNVINSARKELEHLQEIEKNPEIADRTFPTEAAIANGESIVDAVRKYGTKCQHSPEVLEAMGIYLTRNFKEQLQDIDRFNFNYTLKIENDPLNAFFGISLQPNDITEIGLNQNIAESHETRINSWGEPVNIPAEIMPDIENLEKGGKEGKELAQRLVDRMMSEPQNNALKEGSEKLKEHNGLDNRDAESIHSIIENLDHSDLSPQELRNARLNLIKAVNDIPIPRNGTVDLSDKLDFSDNITGLFNYSEKHRIDKPINDKTRHIIDRNNVR